ncbi:MAG: phosphoribosylformylglycinamidine cyclo-ligase [Myxococcota bacterium]|nr:phosphoribosylformylglycinamidine cyclo-ligase [Myxococcota bacterium]
MSDSGLTYKDAGVDIDAGEALVDRIKKRLKNQSRHGLLGGVGGFASMISLKDVAGDLEDPVLVSGTDGVGTKLALAFETGKHNTVGIDLVAMCVNDILTCGAKPIFFLDYFATGKLDVDVADQVISGIAEGCRRGQCTLVGGETAEMPGLYSEGEYDLAGFAVGVVDRSKIIDGSQAVPGDLLIGIKSRGLHSNGYSLARRALLEHAGHELQGELADQLLEPTALYTSPVQALLEQVTPHAMAHITGGGIVENLPRVLPQGTRAIIDRDTWQAPEIFTKVQQAGNVADQEMFRTFNMGIGFILVVKSEEAQKTIEILEANGDDAAFIIGELQGSGKPPAVEWAK